MPFGSGHAAIAARSDGATPARMQNRRAQPWHLDLGATSGGWL